MKRLMLSLVASVAAFTAVPAHAVAILPGSSGLIFDPFVAATQGTLQATTSVPGIALTFAGVMRSAVYRNTFGTLDFYYQVARTGPGSTGANQMIDAFTAADFSGFEVFGFVSAADPDAEGFFTVANNPGLDTTTTGRNPGGSVLETDFGVNGLAGTENSATYIFRTNARAFTTGTFGIIDGSTFSGLAFAPTSAVPEPASWGLMLTGFGVVGGALRKRRHRIAYAI